MEQKKTRLAAGSRRLDYLDNTKAFAMLMVVLGHCSLVNTYPVLYQWIGSFHVPVFFVISGILLGIKKERKGDVTYDLAKKLKTYMLPFYVFSLLNIFVVGGLKYLADTNEGVTFVKDWLFNVLMLNGRAANWFLSCLFLAELIFIFELRHFRLEIAAAVNVVLAAAALVLPHNVTIVLVFFESFQGLLCLNAGYLLYIKRNWLKEHIKQGIFLLLAIAYIIILVLNGNTAMNGLESGNYPFLYYFEILLGSIVILVIFRKIASRPLKLITWIGQNTIVLLTTHQTVLELIWVIDEHSFGLLNKMNGALPFALCMIVVLIEIPVIWICNHYLYFLFGKKKPGTM